MVMLKYLTLLTNTELPSTAAHRRPLKFLLFFLYFPSTMYLGSNFCAPIIT